MAVGLFYKENYCPQIGKNTTIETAFDSEKGKSELCMNLLKCECKSRDCKGYSKFYGSVS